MKKRILLLNDAQANRETIKIFLTEMSSERVYDIVEAENISQAQTAARTAVDRGEPFDYLLVDVGLGKITPDGFKQILLAKDRNLAGATAPPHGLFLMKVTY